ncbi:MAG: hypothetical protein KAT15_08825 [Bacteroidales bacterium]|nr:hypothetical protein [Bacteroidales bacterium]
MTDTVFLGIDLGSTSTKLVAISGKKILHSIYLKNDPGLLKSTNCKGKACSACNMSCSLAFIRNTIDDFVKDIHRIHPGARIPAAVLTGNQASHIPFFRDDIYSFQIMYITEILAHTAGVEFLYPDGGENCMIIDIGGLDNKVILTKRNKKTISGNLVSTLEVVDFEMNDLCAAGTGAYFENITNFFHGTLDEFSSWALKGMRSQSHNLLSPRCATFANSMLTRLQHLYTVEELAAAACRAQALNIFNLASPLFRFHDYQSIYFQGGVASNAAMGEALEEVFKKTITVPELSTVPGMHKIIGALGASYLAEKYWPLVDQNGFANKIKEHEKQT